MNPVVVGTGSHCRAILSLLLPKVAAQHVELYDVGTPLPGEIILGVQVAGGADELRRRLNEGGEASVYLAIGDNRERARWFGELAGAGVRFPNLVSPHAVVDASASMGEGNVVGALAHIGSLATVGSNNLINTGAIIEHEVKLGSHCHVAPGAVVAGRCRLGDRVFLGANAAVRDRVAVGDDIVVGAGAAVIRSLDEPGTYAGVPAGRIRP